MAINPHDDYEALAKLLYPSIEASGNVYYGQTRKLTIDELFDKNNNGFESYFCSCRKENDSSPYEQHFHWKLGPFSDTVKIVDETYKDYPVAWLKYDLTKKETERTNVLNAGEYNTYEVEYILGQQSLYCSLDGLLPDGNMYNNSNFFLDTDDKALYVLLYKAPVYEDMDKPLYIEALTDDLMVFLAESETLWPDEQLDKFKYKYGFEYNSLNEDLILQRAILVKKGCRIYFRCEDRPEFSDSDNVKFYIFPTNPDDEVAVGGNIESMAKFENDKMLEYAYVYLFYQNNSITDASKLYIGKLSDHSCKYLFSECIRLKTAPAILPCFELKPHCYEYMFYCCDLLENAPILPAEDGAYFCYANMFSWSVEESVDLHEITCLLKTHDDDYTYQWLEDRTGVTSITVLENSGWESATSGTIPEGCNLIERESTTYTSDTDVLISDVPIEKYLVTHGTNNENNGRGDITDPSTLANMEKSFDENNNHPMNTYNADGSFNQEIWGYKSFCSPVQFRNGIYTDNLAILSTYDSGSTAYDTDFSLTGSIIKSTEIDGLEINLRNSKYYVNANNTEFENISFSVPLQGYKNSEKLVNCEATLKSTCDYEYIDESGDAAVDKSGTVSSTISSRTQGDYAISTISALISDPGTAEASVETIIDTTGNPKVVLNVLDRRDGTTSTGLTISKSGSEFSGDVTVDHNLTVKNTIIANTGIASHGDITVDDGKKFKGNLEGVIPYVERDSFIEDRTVPVGCIVFLRVEYHYAEPVIFDVGAELSSDYQLYELYIGCFNATGVATEQSTLSKLAPKQIFRTLSQGICVGTTTHVLAIRID